MVGHLKDLVLRLIERHDSRRQRELNEEHSELENDALRLENAKKFVQLARDLGYSEADFRRLVAQVDDRQSILVQLIERRKLTAVSNVSNSNTGPDSTNG